jgi:hypothetical protein
MVIYTENLTLPVLVRTNAIVLTNTTFNRGVDTFLVARPCSPARPERQRILANFARTI